MRNHLVFVIIISHTVPLVAQHPFRVVQIVLRLYGSVSEILTGFDLDAPCFAFDGNPFSERFTIKHIHIVIGHRVWSNPRGLSAIMRRSNIVDLSRMSPSFELRLVKYASRGYEIRLPSLRREDVNPDVRLLASS